MIMIGATYVAFEGNHVHVQCYTKLRIKYYYIRLDLCSLRSMAAFHTKVILMSYTQFSIRYNHMQVKQKAAISFGKFEERPTRLDMEEVACMLGIDFIVSMYTSTPL